MERQAERYSNIRIVNVDNIRPQQNNFFTHKDTINGKGYEEMWKFMDQFLQEKDSAQACNKNNLKLGGAFNPKFGKKKRWWPYTNK